MPLTDIVKSQIVFQEQTGLLIDPKRWSEWMRWAYNRGLEDAAKVCDEKSRGKKDQADNLGKAIRALKEEA